VPADDRSTQAETVELQRSNTATDTNLERDRIPVFNMVYDDLSPALSLSDAIGVFVY
jgi:hypothetical protein